MKLSNSFQTAIIGLKTNKTRSFLTILGIVIGISSVILMMSLGDGAQNLILGQIMSMGPNNVYVKPGSFKLEGADMTQQMMEGMEIKTLTLEDMEAIEKDLLVELVAPMVLSVSRVIYQNNDKKVSIDKVGFQNVIKRVSLFSNEASKLVKFFFKENQVEITAQDIDFSISAIEVLNCLYEDEPIRIGFKSTFVVDILQNMTCQDVSLSMIDARRAALMFPTTYENPNEDILVLIMPLMIDDEIKEEETDNEE